MSSDVGRRTASNGPTGMPRSDAIYGARAQGQENTFVAVSSCGGRNVAAGTVEERRVAPVTDRYLWAIVKRPQCVSANARLQRAAISGCMPRQMYTCRVKGCRVRHRRSLHTDYGASGAARTERRAANQIRPNRRIPR
uniref:Uncharacterized protein n=1 Tax=Plectus sambesii TaxID=2011161 RepID=A0A914VK71_9BILA